MSETIKGVETVTAKVNRSSVWKVCDTDRIRDANAVVFYVKSRTAHRYRNVLDEVVVDIFETWVRVAGELCDKNPADAAEGILTYAKEDLRLSKRCI